MKKIATVEKILRYENVPMIEKTPIT